MKRKSTEKGKNAIAENIMDRKRGLRQPVLHKITQTTQITDSEKSEEW